jgi:hypothetical protein
MPLLLLVSVGGCRSKAKPAPMAAGVDAAASSSVETRANIPTARAWRTAPVFSAPIAAARSAHVSVVAGLVAAQQVIRVMGLSDGRATWTTDIIPGAKWSAGAELGIQRAADGVSVVWRDGLGAAGAGTLVFIGANGQVRGAPIVIGAAACTTADGLAWVEPRGVPPAPAHPVRVLVRSWAEPGPREVMTLSPDRSPTLVCGARSAFVLGDGDDDLTVDVFVPGNPSARRPTLVLRDSDFADEEREHEAFTVGDELDIVRIGVTGAVATRTVAGDQEPTPWRKLKHVLSDDDDLVAVDGEPSRTLLVFTRDTDTACPTAESGGQRVRALDVPRGSRSGGADRLVDLAPPDCEGQRGPFWIPAGLSAGRGPVVAWVERGASPGEKAAPPVSGLAYRVVGVDGVRVGRIPLAADAVVDGDCDETACFAAALLREPGSDGMSPGAMGVVTYP